MAVGELYTVTFRWEGAAGGYHTTLSYKMLSGTLDQNTLTLLADNRGTVLSAFLKSVNSNQMNLVAIKAFQMTGRDETPGLTRFAQPNAGIVASEALPLGGAAVLSILTDAPNAKFNGRMFLSGVPESFQDEGQITAGGTTAYNSLGTALLADTTTLGPGLAVFTPVVISRFLAGVKRTPPIGHAVLAATVNPFVKNQRRRNTRFLGVGAST